MKAKILESDGKMVIEISLDSLGGKYRWPILLSQDKNREPVEIQEEKKKIANKIINLLNKESN